MNKTNRWETLVFSQGLMLSPCADVTGRVSRAGLLCAHVGKEVRAQLQSTWVQAPARASCFSMTSASCAEWEPTPASTCKTVFEEWSYEEVLQCQTSVPSITLQQQCWLYSRARAVNKLKSSRGRALLTLSFLCQFEPWKKEAK